MSVKELPDGVSRGDLKKLKADKVEIATMRHGENADLGDKRIVDRISFEKRLKEKKKLVGFSVREYETCVLLQNGRLMGLVPSGLWELDKKVQIPGTELIWVNTTDFKVRWGVGNIYTKNLVQVGAHGELVLKVDDPQNFVMNLVAQKKAVERDQIEEFLLNNVTAVLKNHFSEYEMEGLIKERERFITVARAKLQDTFSRWGLKLVNLEVMGWNFPPEFEQLSRELWEMKSSSIKTDVEKSKIAQQADLTKAQLESQAELAAVELAAQKAKLAAETELEKARILREAELEKLRSAAAASVSGGGTVAPSQPQGAAYEIAELEKKMDALEEKLLNGEISEETFQMMAKRTQAKIDALKNQ
ncbi:MAG: SPFH domain-containing protein [Promethearchaeota archaeon]